MDLTDVQLTNVVLFFIVAIPTIIAYNIGYIVGAYKIKSSTMKMLESKHLKDVRIIDEAE